MWPIYLFFFKTKKVLIKHKEVLETYTQFLSMYDKVQ